MKQNLLETEVNCQDSQAKVREDIHVDYFVYNLLMLSDYSVTKYISSLTSPSLTVSDLLEGSDS